MFKEVFKNIDYPALLDTFDELKLEGFPPWELINLTILTSQNIFLLQE
jgi:hypothetical protein